jgi:pyridoxamine 5'-phosphate oxidase
MGLGPKHRAECDLVDDPLTLFQSWLDEARAAEGYDAEAMAVATATPDGAPSARMVLLKGFDERGIVFFTNYGSRKGDELAANPRAALLFHWAELERQVRIEGPVERIPPEESAAYFDTRDRGSQLGAWASKQSREMRDRQMLEDALRNTERRFDGIKIQVPPFWGGYQLVPLMIEFWEARPSRLHARVKFDRPAANAGWRGVRLFP